MSHTLGELANDVGGRVEGDADYEIENVASLESAGPRQLSFFTGGKHKQALKQSKAGAIVLSKIPDSLLVKNFILVENPLLAFALIADKLNPIEFQPGIHPDASIDPAAKIDPSAYIGPQSVIAADVQVGAGVMIGASCVIGDGCDIGENTRLHANVTLADHVLIGRNVIIHSGAVIGSDGFGMANDQGQWIKVPQLGSVEIGNDVEIGANTTIDRGTLDNTIIGNGVKLDNQIQIAHNVQLGDHTAVAGCVGIAGSAVIGRHCTIAGGVGIAGQLEIADNVHITAMSFVTKSINKSGAYSSGTPIQENSRWQRNYVRFTQLDEMAKRLKQLEVKINKN